MEASDREVVTQPFFLPILVLVSFENDAGRNHLGHNKHLSLY